ncbi:ATP-binding cassette domain-containing protein [Rossellomorea vietnamensis]|uniref:ATP-binding cassette domain-containing protein n=1 Tax=Rossellomorea vietnamensis TaxID=218284 RepID=A0A5D4ME06_9BACI|nr:ATP-binding cassette domain-containing protein [Rossellomorea vietnamensis]TYR99846.1 ATP-binding cassette domain-containing protein [Rossellomorea vietnamensis]
MIYVDNVKKNYVVPVRESGLKGAMSSFLKRQKKEISAVKTISFEIPKGEMTGFIGSNGAGKSTTLKMLSGILHPSSGTISVSGYTPYKRQPDYLKKIALIRGSKPLFAPADLTALDALEMQRIIYDMDYSEFRKNYNRIVDWLGIVPYYKKPLRTLSLGERMRCGLACSLVYNPEVLFLDEPTIGLDSNAQNRIRHFLKEYNRETNATIMLTSHYMEDVTQLCERIMVIDEGRLLFDGNMNHLIESLTPYKLIIFTPEQASTEIAWDLYGVLDNEIDGKITLRVPSQRVPAITARLLSDHSILDLTVENPSFDSTIEQLYKSEVV